VSVLTYSNTATTSDPRDPGSTLLRIRRDGEGYIVQDIGLGTVYGSGETAAAALADWAQAVQEHVGVLSAAKHLSPHLRQELRNYSAFLGRAA
jgi:hypothetical protein